MIYKTYLFYKNKDGVVSLELALTLVPILFLVFMLLNMSIYAIYVYGFELSTREINSKIIQNIDDIRCANQDTLKNEFCSNFVGISDSCLDSISIGISSHQFTGSDFSQMDMTNLQTDVNWDISGSVALTFIDYTYTNIPVFPLPIDRLSQPDTVQKRSAVILADNCVIGPEPEPIPVEKFFYIQNGKLYRCEGAFDIATMDECEKLSSFVTMYVYENYPSYYCMDDIYCLTLDNVVNVYGNGSHLPIPEWDELPQEEPIRFLTTEE